MISGIYKIENKTNGKVYIGKSLNIYNRFRTHKWALRQKDNADGRTNKLLFYAVKKYGIDNFTFDILEQLNITDRPEDRDLLSKRELHFIDLYDSCNSNKGYNLQRESPTVYATKEEVKLKISQLNKGEKNPNFNNRWSMEQKQQMSEIKKRQIKEGLYDWMQTEEWKKKVSDKSVEKWKDPERKKAMALKVSEVTSRLRFYEYDKKTKELKRVWESISEIKREHPTYFLIAIYNVCNGHKKSYKGSIWKSERKCAKL